MNDRSAFVYTRTWHVLPGDRSRTCPRVNCPGIIYSNAICDAPLIISWGYFYRLSPYVIGSKYCGR